LLHASGRPAGRPLTCNRTTRSQEAKMSRTPRLAVVEGDAIVGSAIDSLKELGLEKDTGAAGYT
jgi:hypothetical protein